MTPGLPIPMSKNQILVQSIATFSCIIAKGGEDLIKWVREGGGGQGNYLNFIKRGVFLNYSLMMIKCSRDSFSLHNLPPSYPSSYDFTQKSERLNSCKSIVEKML